MRRPHRARLVRGHVRAALATVAAAALAGLHGGAGAQAQRAELIAFERYEGGFRSIYVMNADGSNQRRLTRGCCFAWSPDGTRIAFHRRARGEIRVIGANGRGLRTVMSQVWADGAGLTWSPDGKQIAFSGTWRGTGAAIFVVNADGTGMGRVSTPPAAYSNDVLADWSPDGAHIAYERDKVEKSRRAVDRNFIIVVEPDGTGQRVLTREIVYAEHPVWSQDGLQIAFQVVSQGQSDIYLMHRNGSGSRNLTRTQTRSEAAPRWSPDGRELLFESLEGQNRDVHVLDAAGTNQRVLVDGPAYDAEADWSADGTRVVFTSNRDGSRDIYVTSSTGASPTNLTNGTGVVNELPAWRP